MIVIVCGMHRSGTSALAGLLHHNGIVMGEKEHFKPRPKKNQNAKGYYENYRFRILNDRILASCGYKVKSFSPDIPSVVTSPEFYHIAHTLLKEYAHKYSIWGWKDPRTCLTLDFWLNCIGNIGCKVLVIERQCEAVVESLWKRRHRGDRERFRDLVEVYQRRLESTLYKYNVPSLHVSFDLLCEAPDMLAKELSEFLGHSITDCSFIDARLRHNR